MEEFNLGFLVFFSFIMFIWKYNFKLIVESFYIFLVMDNGVVDIGRKVWGLGKYKNIVYFGEIGG